MSKSKHLQHPAPRRHLREAELAARWNISQRTLQRWRAEHYGPAYVRIGGTIRYRFEDILAYETAMRRAGDQA